MKALAECEFDESVIDGKVWVIIGDGGYGADAPRESCQLPDGSPLPESWPLKHYGANLRGRVLVDVVEPEQLLTIKVGSMTINWVESKGVTLIGQRGRPEYRLVVVGELPGQGDDPC